MCSCLLWCKVTQLYVHSFLNLYFIYGIWLISKVVLASGVQQSDSVIHVSIVFQILFPFRLVQSIESSLCSTAGPC